MRTDRLGELAQHMVVVVGEKLAQALVLFGIGAGEHTDKGRAAAVAIQGQRQSRLDERGLHRFQVRCRLRLCLVQGRSEEHTSELQSLMRISYAVFCLQKKHSIPTRTSSRSISHTPNVKRPQTEASPTCNMI